jgi:hypothetical protein
MNEVQAEFYRLNEVRDLEQLVQVVARDCHEALGVKVVLRGRFILTSRQTLSRECEA